MAIWWEWKTSLADEIALILNDGSCGEIAVGQWLCIPLGDTETLKEMLYKWNVHRMFRTAYKPSGNGIVKRHHRAIQDNAERGHISLLETMF